MRSYACLLAVMFCLCGTLKAQATHTVTNLNDAGAGSLREAIANASDTTTDTIVFQNGLSGTISLTSRLQWGKSLIIDGTAVAPGITISGNNTCEVMWIDHTTPPTPIQVEISHLRILNGNGIFGGMVCFTRFNTLILTGVTFEGCSGPTAGALYLFQGCPLVMTNCVFLNNSSPNEGGALYSYGTGTNQITMTGCSFIGNSGYAGGAMEIGYTNVSMTDCVFSGNSANVMDGGALALMSCPLTAVRCSFTGNTTPWSGGAIFARQGTVGVSHITASDCTFEGNVASGMGGGAIAIADETSVHAFINCTFSGNTADGATGVTGSSTSGAGGALLSLVGNPGHVVFSMSNCTLAGNTAVHPTDGNTICLFTYDASASSSVRLLNTIISGPGSNNVTAIGQGTTNLISDGNNICSDHSANLTGPHDQPGTDPLLAPIADNGGPTRTHLPLPSSPAIDKGRAVAGLTTDQRGVTRPIDNPALANAANGDGSDVGAVEAPASQPTAPSISSSPAPTTATVGSQYTHTFVAAGNPQPVLSASGLPAWMTFTPSTGVLQGTPGISDIGTIGPITITAANGTSPDATEVLTITVAAAGDGGGNGDGGSGGGQGCSAPEAASGGLPAVIFLTLALLGLRRRRA